MKEFAQYIPHTSTIVWIIIALVILSKLNFFLQIFKEVISEKMPDGTVGSASIKRFPTITFTFLVCYMVVGYMRNPGTKEFNETAFWGLMLFISLSTTVLSVTQAGNLLDKINIFKGRPVVTKSEETNITTKTQETVAAPQEQAV